ncbi:DedA family protein [Nisaea acidiphila]|uniref:DedA family protein n=1 Tax=Nisaea acidiphila TaxID=1862145 RepID=A0A9J7AX61_9PROT|nr:YqaA family protein [Nisaea acidiphila]UUX50836.1 DedA family protein [Nisaea acidiphila]
MLQATYDRLMRAAAHRRANYWLALISFIESSVFPIPPDTMLIPMVLADRNNAWKAAGICTIASVLGGLAGYAIGALLYEAVGLPLLEFYGYAEKFASFTAQYNEWGAWIVFGAGVTPFPYKVITIASGVTHLDLLIFTVASVLARGIRFYLVAALCWRFGPAVQKTIEKNLGLWTTAAFLLLVGGFALVKYLG